MKKIIFTVLACALSQFCMAQVTLTAANAATVSGPFLAKLNFTSTSNVKAPAMGANQTWNYDSLKDSVNAILSFFANANANFPNTDLVDSNMAIALLDGFGCRANQVVGADANGIFSPGIYVKKQSINISTFTGGANDSIIVPAQAMIYQNRENFLAFPATFNSSWTTHFRTVVNFRLQVSSPAKIDTPCSKVTNTIVVDSVVGWGNLAIPASYRYSIGYPALMVVRKTMTVDSFYVKNAVPSPLVAAFLKITEGQASTDYVTSFYTPGRSLALLTMDYGNDKNYSSAPTSVYYSGDTVRSGIDMSDASLTAFAMYPNPAGQGTVNISFNKLDNTACILQVCNMLGQVVQSRSVSGMGTMTMALDMAGAKAGMYVVNIISGQGAVLASQKLSIGQ